MNIHFDVPLRFKKVSLDQGDYAVELDQEGKQIILRSAAGAYKLEAGMRSSKMQVIEPSVQLRRVQGEKRHLLVVRTPQAVEWVVSLDEE